MAEALNGQLKVGLMCINVLHSDRCIMYLTEKIPFS